MNVFAYAYRLVVTTFNDSSNMTCLPLRANQDLNDTAQPPNHIYPPSSQTVAQTQPQTWAEYLKRFTRRDTSVGISRTWVKKGRTGSHGEVAVGSGEAVMSNETGGS